MIRLCLCYGCLHLWMLVFDYMIRLDQEPLISRCWSPYCPTSQRRGSQDKLALDASTHSLLVNEAVGPRSWKRSAESPRPLVPIATIPEWPPAGVAASGGPFEPHCTPNWNEGWGGYLWTRGAVHRRHPSIRTMLSTTGPEGRASE
jgi:hypothetical protein